MKDDNAMEVSDRITIACVLRLGGDFDWRYVECLYSGIKRNTKLPFRFVCLTNMAATLNTNPNIAIVPLTHDWPGWWSKINLFSLQGPTIYFDLDTVIVGSIDDLIRTTVLAHAPNFMMRKNPHTGDMSSNVMAWSGDYQWLVNLFESHCRGGFIGKPKCISMAHRGITYRGDQDWIADVIPSHGETVHDLNVHQFGIYSYKRDIGRKACLPNDASIIVFHGTPRPHELRPKPRWLMDNWNVAASSNRKTAPAAAQNSGRLSSSRNVAAAVHQRNRLDVKEHRRRAGNIREWRPPRRKIYCPIPKLWNGSTCYILGGGPSLKDFDVSVLNGQHVIAVNNSYKIAFFAEVLFFGDCWWYEQHRKALSSYSGVQITTCQYEVGLPYQVLYIQQKLNMFGISKSPRYVVWNMNAGACAVNVAVWLGAKKIVLLGYDMRQIDGHNNWHSDHWTSDRKDHNPYREFLLAWPYIARDAKAMGIEIVNATPGSALTQFPIIDPNELFGSTNETAVDDSLCAEIGR